MSQGNACGEDFWDKVFDKSKATKLPDKFPGDVVPSQNLQLEDVNEVITDELDKTVYSEVKRDLSKDTRASTDNGSKRVINESSTVKIKPVQEYSFAAANKPSTGFKKPNDLFVDTALGKQVKPNPINKPDDQTASLDIRENENTPTHSADEDDVKQKDPKESAQGEHHVEHGHAIESDTVAELEEIFVAEKAKMELSNVNGLTGRDITLEEAKNLRFLLFGTLTSTFDNIWTEQNIRVNDDKHHAIRYHKGPTEGVMACIQAYFLKHVLFDEINGNVACQPASHLKACLISSIADILWQAGMHEKATLCLPSSQRDLLCSSAMKPDGLIEKLQCFEFSSKEDLQNFIQQHFHFFEGDRRPGCVTLIYSLILSRSIERVSEDMEGPYECLIAQGTSSQALLNLLIFGKATPNIFNMSREIKNENGKMEMHHGISRRSEIGFLSFGEVEDPKNAVVGSMLKTPVFPIWVASLKRHICILFSKKRKLLSDWKLERRFELFYFGGLPRNSDLAISDVRLTIDTVRPFDPDDYDYDFNSEVEDTIRTKWQDCVIGWNGFRRF